MTAIDKAVSYPSVQIRLIRGSINHETNIVLISLSML